MNGKLGLSGISIIFAIAILSACGGGSGGSSGSTTPPNNTGTTPPPDNSAGGPRPSSVAGFVYVANNQSDNVSAYAINASTGTLLEVAGIPFAAGHLPIDLAVHPSGRFVYVPNSESNNVSAYTVDARTGALTSIGAAASGIGPIVIALDPSGNFAYVGNNTGKNISAYTIDAATGALSEIPGSPFSAGDSPFTVTVDPSGRFVYATLTTGSSSRVDRVVSYSIDATTGALTSTGTANTGFFPDAFTLEPLGRFAYVANDLSASISVYSIDSSTGALSEVAGSPFTLAYAPISITVDTAGKFLYIPRTDTIGNSYISVLSIDSSTGVLSEIPGSPFAAGLNSTTLTIAPSGKFAYVGSGGGNAGSLSVYAIDAATGALTNIGAAATPNGSYGVKIDPSGRVAYSIYGPRVDAGSILAFTLNTTTGEPTYIGSVPTGIRPGEINFIW
jgi:6-phosphogluconolactonase